jgi:hypothetical protein
MLALIPLANTLLVAVLLLRRGSAAPLAPQRD